MVTELAEVDALSPIYLTLDDVQKIYAADLSDSPHLAIQRDIFVFQCNIGCCIGDLLRLKKRDVIYGAIEYIPTKTIKENARTVVVPLNSVAQEIVDRYADYPGDKLLPFESSERFNDNIKIIFEKAEVTYLVSALTGHVEGSRAFSRYRTIDIDMKKDLVKILEGKQ